MHRLGAVFARVVAHIRAGGMTIVGGAAAVSSVRQTLPRSQETLPGPQQSTRYAARG